MSHRRRKSHPSDKDRVPASSPQGKAEIAEAIEEMRKKGELPNSFIAGDNDEEIHEQVKMIRVQPVCWGIPFDEVVFAIWAKHMLGRVRMMPWDDTNFSGSTYLPDARNIIHERFVNRSKCDFLMMLDSDVIPPPDFLHHLLKHMETGPQVRIVGGWYRRKADPYNPVVYHWNHKDDESIGWWDIYDEDEIKTGLGEVDGAGAGCWLMHRMVAEAIGPKPYNMNEGGEDLHLCQKVKAAGFKLWIDWDIKCAHAGVAVA